MGKRVVGALFCITSLFLYILPNILTAIIVSGKGIDAYSVTTNFISFKPLVVITAIVGIAYLLYAEISSVYKLKQRDEGKKSE
jgi:hypothetical protein